MHAKCANFETVDELMASCHQVNVDEDCAKLFCDSNHCPLCHETVVRSRATLIITPPAILAQWQREISRHVDGNIKNTVVIYRGVKAIIDGSKESHDRRYLHPLKLADHDIVLTTFDTLMTDLSHSCENPYIRPNDDTKVVDVKSLRSKKRYRVIPTPLIRIRWWRIILDEAQRVEAPTALSAKMALQLDSVHRWCVTGKICFQYSIYRLNIHSHFSLYMP